MLFLVVHCCPDQVEYKEDGKDKDGEAANVAEANASARRNKETSDPHKNGRKAQNPVRKIFHSLFRRKFVGHNNR